MRRKIVGMILTVCMLAAFMPYVSAATIVDSGTCGDNLTWTLDSNGTLTISGTGEMQTYFPLSKWNGNSDSIKTVVIQNGVTSIGQSAFYYCTSLESVIMADSITTLYNGSGGGIFQSCKKLKEVTLSKNITSLPNNLFVDCISLTNITIPSKVETIWNAFEGCSSLKEIFIPSNVKAIHGVFWNCSLLAEINVAENNTQYCSKNGVLYTKDMKTLVCYPEGNTQKNYTLPNSVNTLEWGLSLPAQILKISMQMATPILKV